MSGEGLTGRRAGEGKDVAEKKCLLERGSDNGVEHLEGPLLKSYRDINVSSCIAVTFAFPEAGIVIVRNRRQTVKARGMLGRG